MANEASRTDQYVRREIEKFQIPYTEQGSDNKEIKEALKNASKTGGGGVGKPEFVIINSDLVIIIEDKELDSQLVSILPDGTLNLDVATNHVRDFAVNGAVHYACHIVEKTASFKEVIAIGITGDTESHQIQPYYVSWDNDEPQYKILSTMNDLQGLHPDNIDEWYNVNILGEATNEQKRVLELQKTASELHEDLRNYGSLEGENKATVVSAILLALNEETFNPKNLTGQSVAGAKDGDLILNAIQIYINREGVMPASKTEILMNKFAFLRSNVKLNALNRTLGMTPLKYYTNKLKSEVLDHFKSGTNFDILGNFYGEFVRYGGSDGNSLGIVLTPHHITTLMAELIEINPNDYVLDPACGSGAFLISAMNRMVQMSKKNKKQEEREAQIEQIKRHQLLGIESQEKMFTVATTNMILRGDGKSNLQLADMFTVNALPENQYNNLSVTDKEGKVPEVNKILFNPPYSQGKTDKSLTEISFIKHALGLLAVGGKMAVIVPQSTMVGKSKEEKQYKKKILESNTLEAVITLNKNTFHGVGTNPCIAIFTAGVPQPLNRKVKFINFEDDGFVVRKHLGLMDDGTADEKRNYLLDVLNGNEMDFSTNFMVTSSILPEDEWLHSFFYFNNEIPTDIEFEDTIAEYLTFQFNMYSRGRGDLFEEGDDNVQ